MSRAVEGRPMPSPQELSFRENSQGKLVVTGYNKKYLAFLMRDNRLLAAVPFDDTPTKVGGVYIGKVKNVVKNINACFIEISDGELCFLPLADIRSAFLINRTFDGRILEGDELVVQVTRDALKTKQASVTTKISVSGKYLALSAGSPRTGVSSKLSPKQKEVLMDELKCRKLIDELGNLRVRGEASLDQLPQGMPSFGMVIRTETGKLVQGSDRQDALAPLLDEFGRLYSEFIRLYQNAVHRTCYSCLYAAPEPYRSALGQFYPEEYSEVVTDIPSLYETLCRDWEGPVRFYEDTSYPLKKLYGLESKLQEARSPRVWLKSGGYLVIEPTEALTVIDVNTGKYSAHSQSGETFFKINCEAAAEIALQLRLRNLSGIIIVDFINMDSAEKQEELLRYLTQQVRRDRVRTDVIDMTGLGLVEITRRKTGRPLGDFL